MRARRRQRCRRAGASGGCGGGGGGGGSRGGGGGGGGGVGVMRSARLVGCTERRLRAGGAAGANRRTRLAACGTPSRLARLVYHRDPNPTQLLLSSREKTTQNHALSLGVSGATAEHTVCGRWARRATAGSSTAPACASSLRTHPRPAALPVRGVGAGLGFAAAHR
eukprot:scaffold131124_cov63-Phaeocystis_antarctica.AAC.1